MHCLKSSQVESDTYPDSQLCTAGVRKQKDNTVWWTGKLCPLYLSEQVVGGAAKRKQRCNKQYPKDTEAFHGPPDRESNLGKDKASRKTQTTNKKTKSPKWPLNDNDSNDFQPKKKLKSVSQKPWTDLLFTMLYDDGVWYDGTVCGFEYCETETVYKYKISFSDGETTLITLDDPEVKF